MHVDIHNETGGLTKVSRVVGTKTIP